MIAVRPADSRGLTRTDWLQSRHSFSFGHYYDPARMGFGPLRVINEDTVAPGSGFPQHGHANMEILSWVLQGALQHRDTSGGGGVLATGELQWMSAGSGIEHSEFNASPDEPVHFLQIWIQPDRVNAPPAWAQSAFPLAERQGRLRVVASPDGREDSLPIRQDTLLYVADLAAGQSLRHRLCAARRGWLQVARGELTLNGTHVGAGDGAAIVQETDLELVATAAAEVLLFDLP